MRSGNGEQPAAVHAGTQGLGPLHDGDASLFRCLDLWMGARHRGGHNQRADALEV